MGTFVGLGGIGFIESAGIESVHTDSIVFESKKKDLCLQIDPEKQNKYHCKLCIQSSISTKLCGYEIAADGLQYLQTKGCDKSARYVSSGSFWRRRSVCKNPQNTAKAR